MHIELRQIRKHFGPVKANDGISLTFESGRIYGLLGENGAGKSTLMKILSGYQPPDSGEILIDDQPQRFTSPAEALGNGIGMLYQDPLDFPPFRISENYLLGRNRHFFLNLKGANRELKELSRRYGFSLDLNSNIDNLSLGERQQLELVRLLVGGAQLLILDEPTTGISAEQKDILFDSILKLAHEEGKTVILVSHKLDEVQDLCGHAYVLQRGKMVGEASVPCLNETLVEMMFGQVPERVERAPFPVGETLLDVQDLTVMTPQLTVEKVNLQVCKGEVFGFAGLEGSGQRLVMQACAGLVKPEQGKILFDGRDIRSWGYHRRQAEGIAYVAAGRLEEGLVAGLSLAEHVVLAQPEHSFLVDFTKARKETQARIEKFKIVGNPDTTADALSGGNQQRLLFALLNDPLKLILLEHPTRGLDIRSSDWIWELLYRRRVNGTAILFMSADLDEVIDRSDRIAVFSGGKMSRIVHARQTSVDELGHMIGGQV
jgi:general nucleoside transport system ATP-binding protein